MPVTVSPIQTINVRVNPQNQQVVQSSSQFVGASGALAQEALNLANTALAQSNVAIALAEEAVANVHGDRLISTSNGQAILDSSNNFTIPGQLNLNTPGASISTTYFGGGGLVANANVADGITYNLLNVSNQYNQNLGDIYVISNSANTAEAYIDVNDGTTQRTFGFHTTGTFTLPNNAVIDDTTDTNSFSIKPGNTNKTLKLHSSDDNSGVDIQQTAVYIFTNSNNGAVRYWQFDSDGYIIFPDNSAQNTGFTSAYISQINDATNIANYASNKANNALANTSGTFGGNLTISGNLAVLGTTTSVNTEIVNQQEIVAGKLTANANISSTSTNTGSLIVLGGVGVSGNVFANGISLTTNNFTANAITIDGGGF